MEVSATVPEIEQVVAAQRAVLDDHMGSIREIHTRQTAVFEQQEATLGQLRRQGENQLRQADALRELLCSSSRVQL